MDGGVGALYSMSELDPRSSMSASGGGVSLCAGELGRKEWKTLSLYARLRFLGLSELRFELREMGESLPTSLIEWKTVWPKLNDWLRSCIPEGDRLFEGVLTRNSPSISGGIAVVEVSASEEGISMALSSKGALSLLMGMGGRAKSCERSNMLVSSGGGRGFMDDGGGGEKTSCRGSRVGVLLLALNRAPNEAGEGSLPLPLALDTSGVITL